MGIVPCSIILWLMIAAALATTDLFSENQPSSSKDDIFSDRTPGVPVGRLDLQASNGIASLDVGGTNWLLDDGKIDLDSGARSSSNLFFSDDGDLPSFKESNSNSSPDMLDWNLQPQPDLGSPLPDAALNSLVSSLEPNFLLQESIWDDINPPLADNQVGCEFSPADDIALSGKRRRETKCKNPDLRNPSNDRGLDPYNPSPVPWAQHNDPLNYAFSEEFELCAKRIFKDANLPVCKEQYPPPDQIYTEPQLLWAHLYDVSPIVLFSAPSLCPSGQVVWCCELIQRRARMRPDNYNPPIVVHYPLPQVANLIRGSLKWFYDGYTCYRHAQWHNGLISIDALGPINRNY